LNTKQPPHTDETKQIADNMGISLYQRFTMAEAALFLRISVAELRKIVKQEKLNHIELSAKNIEFFGYQLLEFLLGATTQHKTNPVIPQNEPERIIRAKEVQSMAGLSRTTLWRLENKGEFPRRVSLGGNSVGWKLSEVKCWIDER
jgi:predicted DNA-binding transcriptional regulator AlpA